ncbi:sensor domain-containing diguanylate cyclase [Ectobacillus antri]|jgi:diguanylate cyclase (GGDEF)-like protein|uniref:Sensor domain-containing diguanylate cyclase n=1 Tax=Ectobacillus antri TaxID=2486280 RepID=A0ABT6H0V8_9BACI|nr:sensor domain-containing diguanylate cyclase [Ectobacillus antri]MDG4655728.1 sensor domain-containing diguanylate cyclase [Ectobacillus antri]MDG5752403.1 sensor domain-containing diguanylate cyclase [Ectobacillus antri]
MKILHFLLNNTIFQNLLHDLKVNVLFVGQDTDALLLTKNLQPNCLFIVDNIHDGHMLCEAVQPELIILDISTNQVHEFIEKISSPSNVIVILQERTAATFSLFDSGVRYFITPPVTPENLLAAIQKNLYELTLQRELDAQKDVVRGLLEFQQDMLLFVEDDELMDCNQNFLQFFGYDNISDFRDSNEVVADHFLDARGYYFPVNKWDWIEDCLQEPRKVKMKSAWGAEYIFLLRASGLPEDGTRFILIFNDITVIEKQEIEAQKMVTMDVLTTACNAYKFQVLFAEEWEKGFLNGTVFSLVLFDLDELRDINNKYGKDSGDLVLAQLGELITAHLHSKDIFARLEEDTFALLFPATTEREAFQRAEQLRFFIETKKFTGVPRLTASFGVAMYKSGVTREILMGRAKAALKEAKYKGKNQVCLYKNRRD